MQRLEGNYKTTELNRIEELEENTDYTITHTQQIIYRGVDRYIIKLKESKNIYISNYFLEQEFINKTITKEQFTVRTTKLRTTKTKKKEMHVVI